MLNFAKIGNQTKVKLKNLLLKSSVSIEKLNGKFNIVLDIFLIKIFQ